jgi:hypothetical protein
MLSPLRGEIMNTISIINEVRSDRGSHIPVNIGQPPRPVFYSTVNRRRATYLSLLLLGCSLFAGCQYPQDYVDLVNLPSQERHLEFRKLPIEKQVEFYLIRASNSHPADRSFADDIAVRGEDVLPYLLERLEKEPEDYRRNHIIWIFRQIHVNTIDLRNRKEVIDALERAVEKMKGPSFKERSQATLEFIKEFTP